MIFNILDSTTELWMTKYIVIGEIFSSGGATLYKTPSDQTVSDANKITLFCANYCQEREREIKCINYVDEFQPAQ